MSNLLKKEKIVAKSVSSIAKKPSAKSGKMRNSFNKHSVTNDCVTVISKTLSQTKYEDDIFVSPVLSSIKVKMKVKVGSKISPISVDDEDIIFLDE